MNNKKRILIADDEAALLQTMAFSLKRKGYDTVTVRDGKAAWKKIIEASQNNEHYDLIITDIQMPGLSGADLITKIRQAGIITPILAITGFGNMKMVVDLMRSGCTDYLDKPFTMNEFINHITELIN